MNRRRIPAGRFIAVVLPALLCNERRNRNQHRAPAKRRRGEDGVHNGFAKIGAGLYVDLDGGVHVFLGEILHEQGYADTSANREMLRTAFREMYPQAHVSEAA
jgi:hypothetical protein